MNKDIIKYRILYFMPIYVKPVFRFVFLKTIFSEIDIIYRLLLHNSKSKVMIDVGANWGGAFANFLFSGYYIYAFEPDINNRKRLINTFSNFPNLVIDSRAVSNKEELGVSFYNSSISGGISTLHPFHPSHIKMNEKVDVTTLSSFMNINKINYIDFLKVDVEWYDLFVLEGVPWTDCKPKVVLVEFENKKPIPLGYSYNDIANLLLEEGYYIITSEWYPVVQYGGIHRWRQYSIYPCELLNENATGNLIGILDHDLYLQLQKILNRYSRIVKTIHTLF